MAVPPPSWHLHPPPSPHKTKLWISMPSRTTIHLFKSFLKHVISSRKQPLHSAIVISGVVKISRFCNYPPLPISSLLLSTVIRSVSIHTSVYSRIPALSFITPPSARWRTWQLEQKSRIQVQLGAGTVNRTTCDMTVIIEAEWFAFMWQ